MTIIFTAKNQVCKKKAGIDSQTPKKLFFTSSELQSVDHKNASRRNPAEVKITSKDFNYKRLVIYLMIRFVQLRLEERKIIFTAVQEIIQVKKDI